MIEHPDTIAQYGPAAVRAGGIDSDDPHTPGLTAKCPSQLIDHGTLPCSGCAGDSIDTGFPGVAEEVPKQRGSGRATIFYKGRCTGQSTRISA